MQTDQRIHKQFFNFKFSFLQAAKETGALQEAKDKLEKEVKELTSLLQMEKQMRVMILTFFRFVIKEANLALRLMVHHIPHSIQIT